MKNKKGFTLVELLAVIVILAVLVLLAVPSVLKMLDGSKESAFVVESGNIIKAAKLAYSQGILDTETDYGASSTKTVSSPSSHTAYCYNKTDLSDFIDKNFSANVKLGVLVDPTTNAYTIYYYDGTTYYTNGQVAGSITATKIAGTAAAAATTYAGFDTCTGV